MKSYFYSIVSTALLFIQIAPVRAGVCEDGVAYYNQHNYAAANECFRRCFSSDVHDLNLIYYGALTAQQMKEFERAKRLYQQVAKISPNSQVGKLSAMAARNLEGPPESANLPRETWVPFSRAGSHIAIDVELNRHPAKMIFDTGADISLISEGMLHEVGLSIPDRAPDGYGGGVGKAGMTPMWRVPVTLKLGSIERRNFRVSVTKVPQMVALLGRDFYQGFEYSINDSSNTITFKRNGSGGGGSGGAAAAAAKAAPVGPEGSTTVSADGKHIYNVPYSGSSSQIIVEAKLNGTPCKMIFDTGAASCYFTSEQAQAAGIQVPSDAQVVPIQGVGGGSTAAITTIHSFRLGTIELNDVQCAVGGKSVAKYPLLGQSFFRHFEYSIDQQNHVIRFSKSK